MNQSQFIDNAIADIKACTAQSQSLFSHCSEAELNQQPGPNKWSAAQCLDHLILTNTNYFALFEELKKNNFQKTLYQRVPILPSLFGSLLVSILSKDKMKGKTPRNFEPRHSNFSASILTDFAAQNEALCTWMDGLRQYNLKSIIIHSPFSAVVIYSAYDLLTVFVVHEQRHLRQAARAMQGVTHHN